MLMFIPLLLVATFATSHATKPSTANCTTNFITQSVDHFSFSPVTDADTFQERYYMYNKYWTPNTNAPIFFYCGNEADVGLYVNATGLIWENAEAFGALIIFAEHRDYGASTIKKKTPTSEPIHLSHELALADYAILISTLRTQLNAHDSPVIAFGGSYGGKLAAWLRMKYPAAVTGAISASAPLLAFQGEQDPKWDSQSYYRVISETAEYYSKACRNNIHAVFSMLDVQGETVAGRTQLQSDFGLCKMPSNAYQVSMLKYFIRDAFDTMSMGNYPFPSNYIAGTAQKPMPAFPVKIACDYLSNASDGKQAETLFPAIRSAVSVLYNVSETTKCFDLPAYPTPITPAAPNDGIWDWQWCTENLPDSFWFSTDGVRDMFWNNKYNQTLIDEHCEKVWGVKPRRDWIRNEYGGRHLLDGHSNIVFSSGGFDGWSSGGIATNVTERDLTSLMIRRGGHHLDLMFSHPNDPEEVVHVREYELDAIKRWIQEFKGDVKAMSWGDL